MELASLQTWCEERRDRWAYQMVNDGIVIVNRPLATETHLTFAAVARLSLAEIEMACKAGRDVEHITRVTGYFSKVSGWNRGKGAELRDRHRVKVEGD
jgi:hypothetical protein